MKMTKIDFANSYFFRPPGSFARRFESCMVCLMGLTSFLAYYLIEFDLCARRDCENLEITSIFVSLNIVYIAYGLVVLITGIYLFKAEQLERIYRFGIEMTVYFSSVFFILIAFAILKEAPTIT